jgi:DNA-binding beta-propeller fold protein YncE
MFTGRFIFLPLAAVLLIVLFGGCGGGENGTVTPPNPQLPQISIADAGIAEGNTDHTVNLAVTLSLANADTVSVKFSSLNGTAVATSDYAAVSGTLTFPAGVISQNITVTIKGDKVVEPDENFKILLSGAVNAIIVKAEALVAITNDDSEAPINFSGKIFYSWIGYPSYSASKVWLITNDSEVAITDLSSQSIAVWSPNGQMIYVNKNGQPTFFAANGAVIASCTSDKNFSGCAWTPDSSQIIAGVYYDGLYSIDMAGVARKLKPSANMTYDHCPAISRDGQWTYYIHHEYEDNAILFRIQTAKLLSGDYVGNFEGMAEFTTTGYNEAVYIGFTNNDKVVLAYSNKIDLFDPESKAVTNIYTGGLYMARVSPDGSKIAVARSSGDRVIVIDTNGAPLYNWTHTGLSPYKIDWSPDSTQVAIAGTEWDPSISSNFYALRVWPIDGSASRLVSRHDFIRAASRSANGSISTICSWAP